MLNLPTEVVSSEYLTMGDQQFSTSRGHVLYVGDFLARYGPDPLRYFICAAGPETSDAAFTWAEFVTRNNSELVAGWGNLVNRTATMIAKSFGEIPAAYTLEPVDEDVLAAVRAGFDTVGDLLGRHRLRAATAEAMRVVGEVNKYITLTEPFKLRTSRSASASSTILHVVAQCVSRLQHAARRRSCRTPPTRCTWCSAARASSCRCRASTRSTSSTPTTAPACCPTPSSPATTRPRPRGSRAR